MDNPHSKPYSLDRLGVIPEMQKGGSGGGIIWISAQTIQVTGEILSNGGRFGPQAWQLKVVVVLAESIYLKGHSVNLAANSLSAIGGVAPHGVAGNYQGGRWAGDGRTAVIYLDEINSTINVTPDYLNGSAMSD